MTPHRESTREFARAAWLVIVAGGGWWSSRDVGKALEDKRTQTNRLNRMALAGFVQRRELPVEARQARKGGRTGARQRVEYAVMPGCKVPPNLTVSEVSRALLGASTVEERQAA